MDSDEEDFMQEAEQKAKQNYLREEILDMNFDGELFTEFFTQKVPSGQTEDVTFDELSDIVRQFKLTFRSGLTIDQAKEEKRKEEEKERRLYDIPPKKVYKKPVDDSVYSTSPAVRSVNTRRTIAVPSSLGTPSESKNVYTLPCSMLPENALSLNSDIEVVIEDPEHVKGGIFSKDYTSYKITTSPMGWAVRRRFSDFKWLREVLVASFPGVFIQPAPPKRSRGRLKTENIEKRIKFLIRFINSLLRNPLILRSEFMLEFLRERDIIQFQKFRKKHKKVKKPEVIQSLITLTGQVECNTQENPSTMIQVSEYLEQSVALKKKLKRQAYELSEEFVNLSSSLQEYADLFKQLEEIQNYVPENENNRIFVSELYNLFLAWAMHEKEVTGTFDTFLGTFFKFSYTEGEQMKAHIKEQETAYNKLKGKSKNDEKARNMFGVVNATMVSESQRFVGDNLSTAKQNFDRLASQLETHAQGTTKIWEDLLDHLESIPN